MSNFFDESLSSQDIKNIVGARIRNRRNALVMSQDELAQHMNRRREHITRLETGRAAISIDVLLSLSKALAVHPFYFLKGVVNF
jgi:transcriptional regulator with XRE-family HTH domain